MEADYDDRPPSPLLLPSVQPRPTEASEAPPAPKVPKIPKKVSHPVAPVATKPLSLLERARQQERELAERNAAEALERKRGLEDYSSRVVQLSKRPKPAAVDHGRTPASAAPVTSKPTPAAPRQPKPPPAPPVDPETLKREKLAAEKAARHAELTLIMGKQTADQMMANYEEFKEQVPEVRVKTPRQPKALRELQKEERKKAPKVKEKREKPQKPEKPLSAKKAAAAEFAAAKRALAAAEREEREQDPDENDDDGSYDESFVSDASDDGEDGEYGEDGDDESEEEYSSADEEEEEAEEEVNTKHPKPTGCVDLNPDNAAALAVKKRVFAAKRKLRQEFSSDEVAVMWRRYLKWTAGLSGPGKDCQTLADAGLLRADEPPAWKVRPDQDKP